MSFPRVVILFSLVASCVVGYFYYDRSQRLQEVYEELALAPGLARDIQVLALQLDDLQKKESSENFTAMKDPEEYVRVIAQDERVKIGGVSFDYKTESPSKGIVDKIYIIEPADKKRPFTRTHIANFLYELEAKSRRMKVTHLKLEPAGKSLKPDEIGSDLWTFKVEVTSRQRVEADS